MMTRNEVLDLANIYKQTVVEKHERLNRISKDLKPEIQAEKEFKVKAEYNSKITEMERKIATAKKELSSNRISANNPQLAMFKAAYHGANPALTSLFENIESFDTDALVEMSQDYKDPALTMKIMNIVKGRDEPELEQVLLTHAERFIDKKNVKELAENEKILLESERFVGDLMDISSITKLNRGYEIEALDKIIAQ